MKGPSLLPWLVQHPHFRTNDKTSSLPALPRAGRGREAPVCGIPQGWRWDWSLGRGPEGVTWGAVGSNGILLEH